MADCWEVDSAQAADGSRGLLVPAVAAPLDEGPKAELAWRLRLEGYREVCSPRPCS